MAAPAKKFCGTDKWDTEAPGFVGQLSTEQAGVVKEFLATITKDQLESVRFAHDTPESFACRMLRARKFDVTEAATLVENIAAWRKKEKPEQYVTMREWDCLGGASGNEMAYFYPHCYLPNPDKSGRPVYIERTGDIDVKGCFMMTDIDHLLYYHIRSTELAQQRMARMSKIAGRVIDQNTLIVDCKNMSLGMFNGTTKKYISTMSKVDQDYYPETMGKMYVINAPVIFKVVWSMFSGLVDSRTQAKITVLGDKSKYVPILLEAIGAENLPVEYGGKLKIEGGLWVKSNTKKINVGSGKIKTAETPARKGQEIQFKWFANPGDIKYSLSFFDESGVEKVIKPLKDYKDCAENSVKTMATAPSHGKFVETFNNKAGWRSRDVTYRYDIVRDPEKEAAEKKRAEDEAKAKKAAEAAKAKDAAAKGVVGGGGGSADTAPADAASAPAPAPAAATPAGGDVV